MVAAASREIRDGHRVFVGMRLPVLVASDVRETAPPTETELTTVKEYDSKGVWIS